MPQSRGERFGLQARQDVGQAGQSLHLSNRKIRRGGSKCWHVVPVNRQNFQFRSSNKHPRARKRFPHYDAHMTFEQQLAALGLTLPAAPKPVAAYIPAVRTGNLIYVSGQLPMKDGQLMATGPVPSVCSFEAAHAAARQCVLNGLAVIGDQIGGDFSRVVRIVRVGAFVQSDNGWTDQPKVANGGSELLQQLFGEAGRHARAAVGTNALPLGASVEIEMLVEVR